MTPPFEGFRLSPLQERIWLSRAAEPPPGDGRNRLASITVLLDGKFDPGSLRDAVRRVVRRHEILRTVFRTLPTMDRPVQVIADDLEPDWREIDLAHVRETDQPARWSSWLADQPPPDPQQGPVLRLCLGRFAVARHRLSITLPAMSADAATLTMFVDEVLAGAAEPDEPPMQYADVTEWLHELLVSAETDPGRAYWRSVVDRQSWTHPAGGVPGSAADILSAEVLSAADRIAVDAGITVESLLLACWAEVLRRSSGEHTVAIGVARDGRRHGELAGTMGPLTRYVPVTLGWDGDAPAKVHDALRDATGWQEYFDWAAVTGDPRNGASAGFDFVDHSTVRTFGGLTRVVLDHAVGADVFTSRLSCARQANGLRVHVRGDSADRLLARFGTLLRRLLDQPDAALADLDVIGDAEQVVLAGFGGNNAQGAVPTFPEAFEAQVERTPERDAVVFEGRRLTFAALNERANQVARRLVAEGIGQESLVGLLLAPSLDLVVSLLAVHKAGAAYVPLDPANPVRRTSMLLRDAGIGLVLTDSRLAARLPHDGERTVLLDLEHDEIDALPRHDLDSVITPANLAYVIYTSGSTGQPKGVLVDHEALSRFREAMRRDVYDRHGHGPMPVALNAALTFDASLQPLTLLADGHSVHVLSDEVRRDDRLLVEYVRANRLELVHATPTQLTVLQDAGLTDANAQRHVPRLLLVAGEAMPATLWRTLGKATVTTSYNFYGLTETTVNATGCVVDGDMDPSIGSPLSGYEILVLDRRLGRAPIGAVGELYVAGSALARGYLGLPGLTSERFVANPYAEAPGARMYRTGDLGRWRPDGRIEFHGRVDHQVKLRGFRIEPGEVELALAGHPAIREAVVVARAAEPGPAGLIAYCVPVAAEPAQDELRRYLRERLPDYLVPGAFVCLRAFPVSANGKLDRAALLGMARTRAQLDHPYTPPGTEREKALCAAWSDVLGVDVGIDDNFFDLGGDSISSIRVRAKAAEHGVYLSVHQLFEYQTIRLLSEALTAGATAEEPAPTTEFALLGTADRESLPVDVVDAYPMTRMQLGMLYHSERSPELPMYHTVRGAHLRAEFDEAAMRRAIDELVAAHPALRTSFDLAKYSEPLQLVHRTATAPLRVSDLSELAPAVRQQRIDAFERAELGHRFDCGRPSLLRFAVHRRGEDTFQFTVTLHESVVDGWSLASLLTELFSRYRGILDGRPAMRPAPASAFRDYVAAERRSLAEPETAGFWRAVLADAPNDTVPRSPAGATAAMVATVPISAETSNGLHGLARSLSLPVKSVLLAAHVHVLGRVMRSDDVVTGLVSNGRLEVPDGDRVIGQFLNTLPLRVGLDAETWRDLVRQVFDTERRLLPHRRYPVAQIMRDTGRGPHETAFNFTHFHVYDDLAAAGDIEVLDGTFTEQMDLTLFFDAGVGAGSTNGRITASLRCNHLAATQVEQLRDWYADCLAAMAAQPGRARVTATSAVDVPLAARGPRRPAVQLMVHEQFQLQAARTPGLTALVFGDRGISYAELNARANRLAHLLIEHGIGPEDLVALALPRTPEFVVALLAVLKAGAAYLAVDPDEPSSRATMMLADARPALVITTVVGGGHDVVEAEFPLLAMDADEVTEALVLAGTHDPADADRRRPLLPVNTAYVVYTSGSTGAPKGVLVEHRSVANLLSWHSNGVFAAQAAESETGRCRYATTAPMSFDACWEGLLALIAGQELHLLDDRLRRDATALAGYIAGRGVDVLATTPSYARVLIDSGLLADPRHVPSALMLAGEPVSDRLWDELCAAPDTVGYNHYGPTECTVDSHGRRIGAGTPSMGTPIGNTAGYVLDEQLRPVPAGVVGELYLAGINLARGYLNRRRETARRFVADPFDPGGGRMYRTGDLVRWRDDGAPEFVGRVDNQVKLRGFRIEPGEIEAALARCPGVTEVGVAVREDRPGDPWLVAYLAGPGPDVAEAWKTAAEVLPPHMVPARIVVLDALPLTGNGKLDRDALPAPELPPGEDQARSAESPLENLLCGMFADVLGVERVVATDSFVRLGGHSLLAARLVARIRAALDVDVEVHAVLATRTVAELARSLADADGSAPVLRAGPRPEWVPASFAQRRLWFLNRLGPDAAYHMPFALELRGRVDTDALAAAVTDVVERHESLRTVFVERAGEPYQVVTPDAGRVRLTVLTARPDELPRVLDEAARQPFDLAVDLPLRVLLVQVAPDFAVLLVVLHHIAGDGWSLAPFTRDLTTAYEARRAGVAPKQPSLPVQYPDFALWQHDALGSDKDPDSVSGRQSAYWREVLAGLPEETPLPLDRPRQATGVRTGAAVTLSLDAELHGRLLRVARRHDVTVFMALHAAVAALLSRSGCGEDIPLGAAAAGRGDELLDDLVGFFVNTLVLRTDVSGKPSFAELLARVRRTDLAAYAHQDVPFERLVEALSPARAHGAHPLFQIMLVLNNNVAPEPGVAGLHIRPRPLGAAPPKGDLAFAFTEHHGDAARPLGITVSIEYAAELFDAATIEAMAGRFTRLLEQVLADPDRPVTDVEILSPSERHQLVSAWHGPSYPHPSQDEVSVLQEFARRQPMATAVVDETGETTYAALAGRASAVARRLRSGGVGTGDRVATLVDRSATLIGAVLGVLGAGAVYVPLDPRAPVARNVRLLVDSGARQVLVTATDLTAARELVTASDRPIRVAVLDDAVDSPDELLPSAGDQRDLAYVIFTSGSTGRPKGAMVDRRGMRNHMLAMADSVELSADDTIAVNAPLTFDISVWQMLTAITFGGRARVVPDEVARDPLALFDLVDTEQVSVLQVVPSLLPSAFAAWDSGACAPSLAGLRRLVVTGEQMPYDLCRAWFARYPDTPIVNVYGPTECADDVTIAVVTGCDELADRRVPIGRAIRNTRLYVLDDGLTPVPIGVAGELYVAGDGVGWGYLDDPARTAGIFVADPFGGDAGARMYRSGDVVRRRADGQLEFLGRVDDQVKIRGHRIELGEVEVALRGVAEVVNAVVIADLDAAGQRRLVGYVVGDVAHSTLRSALAGVLPDYMIPAGFVVLDELPLTANGKVDRAALPVLDAGVATGTRGAIGPVEEVLCGLFGEVLGIAEVGAEESFFELGGHSLLAVRLVSRVRSVLGVELPIGALFEAPTVASMAARLRPETGQDLMDVLLPLRPAGTRTPVFGVHAVGGLGWSYAGLLRHLDERHPVYALQARGLGKEEELPATLGEMADDYVARIRAVQPSGPYQLIGWSFGGVVAHAMATRLQRDGEQVSLLAMFDAHLMDPAEVAEFPDVDSAGVAALSPAQVDILVRERMAPEGLTDADYLAVARLIRNNVALAREHTPDRFEGDVVYVGATLGEDDVSRYTERWEPFVSGQVERHDVACTHHDLLRPGPLAKICAVLIDRLDRTPRS